MESTFLAGSSRGDS